MQPAPGDPGLPPSADRLRLDRRQLDSRRRVSKTAEHFSDERTLRGPIDIHWLPVELPLERVVARDEIRIPPQRIDEEVKVVTLATCYNELDAEMRAGRRILER